MSKLHFPIRFKILLTLLLLVTSAIGLITFTMANLFHEDKNAYIIDLTASIASHNAQEAESLLSGYYERLQVFGRVMYDENIDKAEKTNLLNNMFSDFPDFVSVTMYADGAEQVTIFDKKRLEKAGLTKLDLEKFRRMQPPPWDKITEDTPYIINSSLNTSLPTFTMAMMLNADREKFQVAAVVRLNDLQNIASRSRVFNITLIDEEGAILAHSDIRRVAARAPVDWMPTTTLRQLAPLVQGKISATSLEYSGEKGDIIAAFSKVNIGNLLVISEIPRSAAFLTSRSLLNNLIWLAVVLLIVSSLLGLLFAHRITRPIEKLSEITHTVGKGDFDVEIDIKTRDEMGHLAGSFNQMARALKEREAALQSAQNALVQSEKMSAFGQLSAGIAHEVKNPLAGILGYTQLLLRKVDQSNPMHKNLTLIEKETKRTKDIIENLMRFARQEKMSMEPTDINQVVEDAIAIVDHQLGINQVKVERKLATDLPSFMGNANQIQQVLMNFMINAQQAMNGKPGTVTITTGTLDKNHIEITVEDTGPGMSKETQAKIFEPFFTTKPAGKGTGLGLSVSFGIIRDHGGTIEVESEPGRGAKFIVRLPVSRSQDKKDISESAA